ncbi:hypothetical protein SVAN01_08596 [Stagonosporopsis vannaccii]|nr:hypothetical protein SVAN01_08596 [Stagonosporopsis vannaccii]
MCQTPLMTPKGASGKPGGFSTQGKVDKYQASPKPQSCAAAGARGPQCSVLDGQLASDATAAETDKDVSSEEVDHRGSMFLLGSGPWRAHRTQEPQSEDGGCGLCERPRDHGSLGGRLRRGVCCMALTGEFTAQNSSTNLCANVAVVESSVEWQHGAAASTSTWRAAGFGRLEALACAEASHLAADNDSRGVDLTVRASLAHDATACWITVERGIRTCWRAPGLRQQSHASRSLHYLQCLLTNPMPSQAGLACVTMASPPGSLRRRTRPASRRPFNLAANAQSRSTALRGRDVQHNR